MDENKEYKSVDEILCGYSTGELTPEQANRELEAVGSSLRLNPLKNKMTVEEIESSSLGDNPPQTCTGWGYMDHGVGDMEKIEIHDGKCVSCDMGQEVAFVFFCGSKFRLDGTTLRYPD